MKIVGVGAGPGMLTFEAARAISQAKLIYGSERSINLVRDHISVGCEVRAIEDYKTLRSLPPEAVVLSTGDPMLSGLGYLEGEVMPGISSMQVACARLKVSQLKVMPITVHGRKMDLRVVAEAISSELLKERCVFLLTDESTDFKALCSLIESSGLHRDVAVFTDLGYPNERVAKGSTSSPPEVPGLSCAMIGYLW